MFIVFIFDHIYDTWSFFATASTLADAKCLTTPGVKYKIIGMEDGVHFETGITVIEYDK